MWTPRPGRDCSGQRRSGSPAATETFDCRRPREAGMLGGTRGRGAVQFVRTFDSFGLWAPRASHFLVSSGGAMSKSKDPAHGAPPASPAQQPSTDAVTHGKLNGNGNGNGSGHGIPSRIPPAYARGTAMTTPATPTPTTGKTSITDQERMIGMEFIRATEAAALSAYKWMGKGDKESADFAACDAIRGMFDSTSISGTVTIGEGIKDDAPGIFKGEKLGTWQQGTVRMAIALDPIDGTTIVSKGLPGSVSVIAAATCESETDDPMKLLADIPSFYMNKISFGPKVKQGPGRIRLDNSVQDNLEIIALKLGKRV